jgi:hypothetical protein
MCPANGRRWRTPRDHIGSPRWAKNMCSWGSPGSFSWLCDIMVSLPWLVSPISKCTNRAKLMKGYLVNCLEHIFLLFFCLQILFLQLFALFQILLLLLSCRNAVFSNFYAHKGLIQLTSRGIRKSPINNQSRQQKFHIWKRAPRW